MADWFNGLPGLLDTWCARHRITLLPTTPPLSYNLVLFGTSDVSGEVVLKLSPPSPETSSEIAALREAAGHGMVRLIDADESASIMMMERIEPGTTLDMVILDDEAATLVAAQTMRQFWRDPGPSTRLWPLELWFRDLYAYAPDPSSPPEGVLPDEHVQWARALGRRLLAEPRSRSLLHGDLHHQNILWGGDRGWVTIDPKGLIGERGYEVATWMLNPWYFPAHESFHAMANRRLDILAQELDEDRQRLAEWCAFHAVLSLVWTLVDDRPDDISSGVELIVKVRHLLD
jgi:streptomycin 6-kinase